MPGGVDVAGKTVTEWTPREELIDALGFVNTEAKACHASPRWDRLHGFINQLLDWLVGL